MDPQAKEPASKAALVAIAEVESRHLTWGLIDVWGANPFGGPADTVFPYANQILEITNRFVVPGSCPPPNPVYPYPRQNLPQLEFPDANTPVTPGSPITFTYSNSSHVPTFKQGRTYYAVFFHGLLTVSVEFDTERSSAVIPKEFENKGIVLAVIAEAEGAKSAKEVLAGPLIIVLQPAGIA